MEFSVYHPGDIDKIRHLFTRTFTDSESETEGAIVGNLAYEVMKTTDDNDLFVFVALDHSRQHGEQVAGCIIFSRLTFDTTAVVPSGRLVRPVAG